MAPGDDDVVGLLAAAPEEPGHHDLHFWEEGRDDGCGVNLWTETVNEDTDFVYWVYFPYFCASRHRWQSKWKIYVWPATLFQD